MYLLWPIDSSHNQQCVRCVMCEVCDVWLCVCMCVCCCRVLQLMNLTDSHLPQHGSEHLDRAFLHFFEQIRTVYIGESVQKLSKVTAHAYTCTCTCAVALLKKIRSVTCNYQYIVSVCLSVSLSVRLSEIRQCLLTKNCSHNNYFISSDEIVKWLIRLWWMPKTLF